MHMWRPTPARVLAYFLPRASVEAVVGDAEALHGQVIPFASPAGRELLPLLRPLVAGLGKLPGAVAERALRAAANALVDAPGVQVADIAEMLAFGIATDFTRAFRRAYGMSPSDFRALGRDMLRV